MSKKFTFQEIIEKAERYCSAQEHCSADVIKKLYDWQADKTDFQTVIDHLKKGGFIDEERYAMAFVRAKFNVKGKGRNRVVMELRQKKIDEILIQKALEQIEGDDYEETLMKWLRLKWKQWEKEMPQQRKIKTIKSVMQKGYEYDAIQKAFQRLHDEIK